MKLVILGGTVFLGRHVVEAALARGHEVTLFHRGRHGADLYPHVEHLHGDRDGGLAPLRGRCWDVAIDTSGYVPRLVHASVSLLADAIERYVFISTISVYRDLSRPGTGEDAATGTLDDETLEVVDGATYGPLKALWERAAEAAMPGRVLILRPGLFVGPHDPIDRFTYWPHRAARGGEVLAPALEARPVQLIDARALAAWTIRLVERQVTGTYNAAGPAYPLTFGQVPATCIAVSGTTACPVWVDETFLVEQGIGPWVELPLCGYLRQRERCTACSLWTPGRLGAPA